MQSCSLSLAEWYVLCQLYHCCAWYQIHIRTGWSCKVCQPQSTAGLSEEAQCCAEQSVDYASSTSKVESNASKGFSLSSIAAAALTGY